jgi:hypothetical protein
MKACNIPELIRDLAAEARAKRQYAERCGILFAVEDLRRATGDPEAARKAHEAAIIAGHAAWAEDHDPEPIGLGR